MVVDQLCLRGVDVVGLSTNSQKFFHDRGIPYGNGKLVDVTLAGAKYDVMRSAISQLISDPESGLIVVAIGSSAQFNPELAVKPIIDAVQEIPTGAPVVAFLYQLREIQSSLEAAHIPCFSTVESCADCISLFLSQTNVDQVQNDSDSFDTTEIDWAIKNIIVKTGSELVAF